MIVAKAEGRRSDREPLGAFDKSRPIGSAPEFAVGHYVKAKRRLPLHDITDRVVLRARERFVVDASGGVVAKRLTQGRWSQQAADMIGAERRATWKHPHEPLAILP